MALVEGEMFFDKNPRLKAVVGFFITCGCRPQMKR
jgi:hypothetical protein